MSSRRSAAVLAAALALAPAASSAAPHALGLNVHQSTDVGLDATRDAGLGWARIDLNWIDAEPSPGAYDWSRFDAIVDGATARGLRVLAVVGYGPAWASAGDVLGDGSMNDVPAPGTYAAFVSAAVQHFQGRVTHYELWNEPNLEQFFEGGPDDYVQRVLLPGAAAVHGACPSCAVVGPGLATVGGEYDVWLDVALGAAKDEIDIVSGHIYAGFPAVGTGGSADSFFHKLESHRVLTLADGTVVWEGPRSFREVMDAHGVQKPFWLTETGLEASLGDVDELAAQQIYYRRVLEAMLTRPWWEATIFYEAFDEPGSGYEWGVVVHQPGAPGGYVAKPVLDLLSRAAGAQPAFGGTGHDCFDGLDNDGDGLVDYFADPGCDGAFGDSEGAPPADAGAGGAGGTAGAGGASLGGGGGAGEGTGGGGGAAAGSNGCACAAAGGGATPSGAVAALVAAGLLRRRRGPGRRRTH